MATHGWGTAAPLEDWLFDEGFCFELFQAVRLLEALRPDAVPVGEGADPAREPVRFRSALGLAFAPSEVAAIEDRDDPRMTVRVLRLASAEGPLPYDLTELLEQRVFLRDTAARDFLDIFNHRLVSLLYRIHRTQRVGFAFQSPDEHRAAGYLFAVMGLLTDGLRGRLPVPDRALLRYAGVLGGQQRSLPALSALLTDFFAVPFAGRPFAGAYLPLEREQRTALGKGGTNRVLGQGALLGGRIWDQEAGVELSIGPLHYPQFLDFLPGSPGLVALLGLFGFYTGRRVGLSLRLLLLIDTISLDALAPRQGPRLGWTSFLRWRPGRGGVTQVRLRSALRHETQAPVKG